MEGEQFANRAGLAERIEQVFGVVAVVYPDALRGLDDPVDGVKNDCSGRACHHNPVDPLAQIIVDRKFLWQECDHRFEP